MRPFCSIIVPVYNIAPWVEPAVASLRAQTCPDWEAICVDDGSTDDSGDRLDALAREDARLHVIHQPNGGVAAARNRALRKARGQWIGFLDGDDAWHPQLLESCAEAARKTDAEVLAFGAFRDEARLKETYDHVPRKRMLLAHFRDAVFYSNLWACLYRADTVRGLRFRPYCRGEDRLWMIEAILRCTTALALDAPLYFYRERENPALTSPKTLPRLAEEQEVHRRLLSLVLTHRSRFSKAVLRGECATFAEATSYQLALLQAPREAYRHRWRILRALSARKGLGPWYRTTFALTGLAQRRHLDTLLFALPWRLKHRHPTKP